MHRHPFQQPKFDRLHALVEPVILARVLPVVALILVLVLIISPTGAG